ncbi:allergin-1 isoform X2 [Nycticebus coucang]|uniref:allergin-1 isoform X2 n=1 Tax=Nycticebus coucang TaxID=9470 RepID=UPI00234CB506|nr:allergin-1 isoform X2 [Nycticebus coucang]
MQGHLNKLFLWAMFSSATVEKAVLDCETTKADEFPSPRVYSKTNMVMRGQNVSLFCSHKNKSLQITYSLFRHEKFLGTQNGTGEPMIFNLNISEAGDLGPYKCKAQVLNCVKYSHDFNFIIADPVTAPELTITVTPTGTERHVTLSCLSVRGSLPINYTFFEKNVPISSAISKNEREPAELNLTRKNTEEKEEYRCEARNGLPDLAQYSRPVTMDSTGEDGCPLCLQLLLPGLLLGLMVIALILAFWILSKYKARKAVRRNAPKDCGATRMEVRIYANISINKTDEEPVPDVEPGPCVSIAQDEAGDSQEIHYATPVFLEVAPTEQEACNDCKTECVYSELIL